MGEPRCKMEREEDPAAFFRRRALHNFTKAVCNGLFCRIRFYGRSLLYFCALKERERRKGSSEDGVKRNLCHRRTVGIPSFTASAYSISGTSPLPCSCEEESYTLAENRGDNASGGRRGTISITSKATNGWWNSWQRCGIVFEEDLSEGKIELFCEKIGKNKQDLDQESF